MNIGIDAHFLGGKQTGNETYTDNLIRSLARIDGENKYRLYVTKKCILVGNLFENNNFHAELVNCGNRWGRVFFRLPLELVENKVDLFHLQYFPPLILSSKFVVTVHDISFNFFPRWFSPIESIKLKFVALAIKKAKRIIAVSEFTKSQILSVYDLAEERITVIYNGVSDIFRPIEDLSLTREMKNKYNLPEDFILYVGRMDARKNIEGLLRIFSRFKVITKRKEKLVLAGDSVHYFDKIHKLSKALGIEGDIILTGYIPEEDLPAVYNSSRLFASFSFYEGFGLPPLEAMACGIPVIVSDIPVFSEVLADAAAMVDPNQTELAARRIAEILENEILYNEMSLQGIKQAKKFSWLETAKKTLEVYNQVNKYNKK
ncbi:MAG: glycosyltransferase family 1 protein [Candidatus Omnitrophica bacterium]|nr:glycosyltransferase family 1 protein [Candidatus Omnitrophota bacterium]